MTLTLVAAGRTGPNRALSFGDEGRSLDERGRRDISSLGLRVPVAICGPEPSVRESAALVADEMDVADALRSIDLGSWVGCRPEEVPSADLGAWFGDAHSTPHGGESVAAFLDRIRVCLRELGRVPDVVVMAKPVVQAAVALHRGVGAAGFFGVDIAPASTWTVDISIGG
ncbi:MAG: histidine phosphatase family protein [Gordonia paraffinivorans]